MNFIVRKTDEFSCISVNRERLDTFIAPELKAELVMLAGNHERNMILDMGSCIYCDSSGLSAILVGNRLCEGNDGTFVICNLSANVEKMIKLANLDTILHITENLEEAEKLLVRTCEL